MSDNEIRLAIATAMGWVWYRIPEHQNDSRRYRCLFLPAIHEYEGQSEKWLVRADGTEGICNMEYMAREGHVPDFPNDLNACHEFEKTLDDTQLRDYCDELATIAGTPLTRNVPRWRLATIATARQRCEAFLKIKQLWKP